MTHTNPVNVILGATGGLGMAIAQTLSQTKATLILIGRHHEALQSLQESLDGDVTFYVVDIEHDPLVSTLEDILQKFGQINTIINVVGYDVRKPLATHTARDIEQSVSINLIAPIRITQALLHVLPITQSATIVHVGGFGDGRLALPFYSVDVATRAGLRSFSESFNREMQALNRPIRMLFFGPTTADTPAERPYRDVWKTLGIPMVEPVIVARVLLRSIQDGKRHAVMGGLGTQFLLMVNALCPDVADWLILRRYGQVLRHYFSGELS